MANLSAQKDIDVSQVIGEHFNDLTKSEKRIANFFNKYQDEAAFLAASEIANRLKLSEATLVRFARSLGFESYPTMRTALQNNFRHRVFRTTKLRGRLTELRESGGIFERLVTSEIDYLTEALQTVDHTSLDAAVELIRTRNNVFVFGIGPSGLLVDYLGSKLIRSARHVIPLKSSGREMFEPLILMHKDDLLIAFSFNNLSPNLQLALEHANKNNTPVILITDVLGAIVKEKVDVILAARCGLVSSCYSLIIPMTIINTMLLMLSQVDEIHITPNLDLLNEYRQRFMQIVTNS